MNNANENFCGAENLPLRQLERRDNSVRLDEFGVTTFVHRHS